MSGKPRYKNAMEMQEIIDRYFEECEGRVLLDADENPVVYKGAPVITGCRPPTVTGLALALGFASRQALINYQGRKEFHDTVTRAKARIEDYAEQRLYDRDGQRGAEFNLRYNYGWRDEADDAGRDAIAAVNNMASAITKAARAHE